MKRYLISDESIKKDEDLTHYPKTSLSILGNYRALVGEDRDASESDHRDCKRRKLQSQKEQEPKTSTKIEEEDDYHTTEEPKLRDLELMSSAVSLICDGRKQQLIGMSLMQQQEHPQRYQFSSTICCSEVSTASNILRTRSDSISSEHSIYRSYEMELPDQVHPKYSNNGRLPRAPRLPTVRDLPISKNIGSQLNSRRYGERPGFSDTNDVINNETIENISLRNQIRFQTVIYH